jgi:hypothetical protein
MIVGPLSAKALLALNDNSNNKNNSSLITTIEPGSITFREGMYGLFALFLPSRSSNIFKISFCWLMILGEGLTCTSS